MSLTSQISATDASFKLCQKIVSSLAEKFSFKIEDGWAILCSRTLENVQKILKSEKRRANPASSIKHPRTAFSFLPKSNVICLKLHIPKQVLDNFHVSYLKHGGL